MIPKLNVNSDALESEEIEPPDQETEEAPAGGSEVGKRKKKKKRRKRAESAKTSENVKEEEEEEEEEQGDEIERTVREVNKLLGEPAACSSTAESVPSHGPRDSILKIQYNFFNPENEFKSIYGSNRTQTDQMFVLNFFMKHSLRIVPPFFRNLDKSRIFEILKLFLVLMI